MRDLRHCLGRAQWLVSTVRVKMRCFKTLKDIRSIQIYVEHVQLFKFLWRMLRLLTETRPQAVG